MTASPSTPAASDDKAMLGIGTVGWDVATAWAEAYARREGLAAPLQEDALRLHAAKLAQERPALAGSPAAVAVLLHNAAWAPRVRAVPPARRLLLLPQCLRDVRACQAEQDAAGLLCLRCGRCAIGPLVELAEATGMVSLVAEGATLVRQLIATGRIEAVVGVGCLASLEKLFPEMLAFGVPGLAVPLRRSGCSGTQVDAAWVARLLEPAKNAVPISPREGAAAWAGGVHDWFTVEALASVWGRRPTRPVELAALEAMLQGGKRWRPQLTATVYRALAGAGATADSDALRYLAVAVECFHKASLVHDDIEDGDAERYGVPTLHAKHGLAVAINAGDFLVGEGYRLLAKAVDGCTGRTAQAMFAVAAEGHRTLCLGQGDELDWTTHPRRLGVAETLAMMTDKTAPAFDVALRLGALLAGADDATCDALASFSVAFGRAFQIRDDLVDFRSGEDLRTWRPNLVLAALCESSDPAGRAIVEAWASAAEAGRSSDITGLVRAAEACGAIRHVERLGDEARRDVRTALDALPNPVVAAWLHGVAAQALACALASEGTGSGQGPAVDKGEDGQRPP